MRVLVDTNILLDVLLDRKPHAFLAAQVVALVEKGEVEGLLGATTVTTVHYVASKAVGREKARSHVQTLLAMFGVAAITKTTLSDAAGSDVADFEDAVLLHAAIEAETDCIVTRNGPDFEGASIPVLAPVVFLAAIQSTEADNS